MTPTPISPVPNALLLTTPSCAHCAALKIILEKLLGEGLLAQVDIVGVTEQPTIAQQYAVKAVPWLKLGPIQLRGSQTETELRQWLGLLDPSLPATGLFAHLLETDALDQVIALIEQQPDLLPDLLPLVTDAELDLKIRLGISAVFETFEGLSVLQQIISRLHELAGHEHPRVRADAAHFLSLTHSHEARVLLQQLTRDADREVREIATEALQQEHQ